MAELEGQVLGQFYYNRYWQLTKKDSVYYFRVSVLDTINNWFAGPVRDFTKAGKLVMTGAYQSGVKNGTFTFYYVNGKIESSGNFVNGSRVGTWRYFYPNNNPKQEVEFFDEKNFKILYYNDSTGKKLMENGTGKWHEEYEEFGMDMRIITEGAFKDYIQDGEWRSNLENGQPLILQTFKKGLFVKGSGLVNGKMEKLSGRSENVLLPHYKFDVIERFEYAGKITKEDYPYVKRLPSKTIPMILKQNPQDMDSIFIVVKESAAPVDGWQAFYMVVAREMKYPPDARRRGIEGKVFVEFVINKDGSLSDVRVLKGIGHGCDEEAIRVVMESQRLVKWNPGTQLGKSVRQKWTLVVYFKLG